MEQTLEIKKTPNYYEHVFQNSIKSDVAIVLPNKTIKAHKEVLGPQNPVFLDQFLSCPQLNKIEISDLSPNAVGVFVDYLYTGKITEGNITEDLFLVAHKYLDPTLQNVCREKLSKNLTILNAAKRFLVFLECKENTLIEETSIFLAQNYNDVKVRLDFKQVFKKPEAVSTIFDAFDYCKITILSEQTNPDQKTLIESATKSDLTIKVHNETFLVHKGILLSRNAVLRSLISALPLDSQNSSSINIPEMDPNNFKIFLKFIYTRNVDKDNISKELIVVVHKYTDKMLKKICEDHLVTTLCEANAIELLELGVNVESKKLKEESSQFIADRYETMKNQAAFKRMSENPVALAAFFSRFQTKIDTLYKDLNVLKNTETFHSEFTFKAPLTVGKTTKSQTFLMKNCHWYLASYVDESSSDYLGVYLQLKDGTKNLPIKLEYTIKVISSTDKTHDIVAEFFQNTFLPDEGWGRQKCVKLSDLKDKEKGLAINGNITVQLYARFFE